MDFPWVEQAIAAAKAQLTDSAFRWTFRQNGTLVEASALGQAAKRSFSADTGPIPVRDAAGQQLIDAVLATEIRAKQIADNFHRASPWPYFTKSQVQSMTYLEQVNAALDQYKGLSLEALSLGPEEWAGLLIETGLKPDKFGHVSHRDIQITAGIKPGIKYIVADV